VSRAWLLRAHSEEYKRIVRRGSEDGNEIALARVEVCNPSPGFETKSPILIGRKCVN
jgi:hypothetical protein